MAAAPVICPARVLALKIRPVLYTIIVLTLQN